MTYEEAYKKWQGWLDCMKVYSSECNKFPDCEGCEYDMVVSEELVRTSMKAISMAIEDIPIEYFENGGE